MRLVILSILFFMSVTAEDKYEVVALPNDFKVVGTNFRLNDNGQVAGAYLKQPADSTSRVVSTKDLVGAKAAIWTVKDSIVSLPLDGYLSYSCDINNNGLVTGIFKSEKNESERIFFWDTISGKVIVGPEGNNCLMNDENIICIFRGENEVILWNPNDNSVEFITRHKFEDFWKRGKRNLGHLSSNRKGTIVERKMNDIFFHQNDKKRLLMLPKGKLSGYPLINDLDEIISLGITLEPGEIESLRKQHFFIVKWHPNSSITTSEIFDNFKLLERNKDFFALDFNQKGQILLGSVIAGTTQKNPEKIYLLTPIS